MSERFLKIILSRHIQDCVGNQVLADLRVRTDATRQRNSKHEEVVMRRIGFAKRLAKNVD